MKNLFLLLATLCSMVALHAQEMSVRSFVLAEDDRTASTLGTMKRDHNGEVTALIRLETTQKGFVFDVGVLGVTEVVEQPDEIWIYVPSGVRRMTIAHSQLGVVRDYYFPCLIEKGRTYVMQIATCSARDIEKAIPDSPALTEDAPAEVDEEAMKVNVLDKQPTFLGGSANQFARWVAQRLVYPEIARENGVQGRVSLSFIIEKDGSLTNVRVVRGVDPALDKEAVRVVSMSPKWTPGEFNGKPVRVTMTFPVNFSLN